MPRSPELEAMLNKVFPHREERIKNHQCVTCGSLFYIDVNGTFAPGTFRNVLSYKEYTISGMCQKCQDSVFGKD